MKWKVSIGYREFIFDTVQEAGIFATAAAEHMVMDDKDVEHGTGISIEPMVVAS